MFIPSMNIFKKATSEIESKREFYDDIFLYYAQGNQRIYCRLIDHPRIMFCSTNPRVVDARDYYHYGRSVILLNTTGDFNARDVIILRQNAHFAKEWKNLL